MCQAYSNKISHKCNALFLFIVPVAFLRELCYIGLNEEVFILTIGQRIKQRRQELGLSVDEVAESIGKNRATIYRYESEAIEKFPINILIPLAKALRTTPAYLIGWENAEDIGNKNDYQSDFILSKTEKELIESFRSFPAEYKAKMINFIHDTKTEIEKDRKLDMLIEQNRKLIHARAAAYGGETADVILTPEEDAKIDELLQKERERKAKNGDDIL